MTSFAAAASALTDQTFATFGVPDCPWRAGSGAPATGVRTILRRPTDEQRIESLGVVKTKPLLRVPVVDAPTLRKGDLVDIEDKAWRLAAAPRKPGDGRVWYVEVEEVGAAGWTGP